MILRGKNMAIAMIAPCLLSIPVPALAAHDDAGKTIRDIEFEVPRGERLDLGRKMLAEAIPIGSSISAARETLRRKGAHCKQPTNSQLKCSASMFDSVENQLQDIMWRITVEYDEGLVRKVEISRDERGG